MKTEIVNVPGKGICILISDINVNDFIYGVKNMICKVNIEDKVKIINMGSLYRSYEKMAEILRTINWRKNEYPDKDKLYTVKGYSKHEDNDNIVVLIEDDRGYQFLIGQSGLEIVFLPFLDDDEFKI